MGVKGCIRLGDRSLYEILLSKTSGPVAIMTSSVTHAATKGLGVDLIETGEPSGNGIVFKAFYESPLWRAWDVTDICVLPVDNPLAEPIIGTKELTVAAVQKLSEEEKMGVLYEEEGRLHVREYTEHPKGLLGYTGVFSCKKSFFEKGAKLALPWHGGEQYAFDAFPFADSYEIINKERKKFFAPIKTKEDLVQWQL